MRMRPWYSESLYNKCNLGFHQPADRWAAKLLTKLSLDRIQRQATSDILMSKTKEFHFSTPDGQQSCKTGLANTLFSAVLHEKRKKLVSSDPFSVFLAAADACLLPCRKVLCCLRSFICTTKKRKGNKRMLHQRRERRKLPCGDFCCGRKSMIEPPNPDLGSGKKKRRLDVINEGRGEVWFSQTDRFLPIDRSLVIQSIIRSPLPFNANHFAAWRSRTSFQFWANESWMHGDSSHDAMPPKLFDCPSICLQTPFPFKAHGRVVVAQLNPLKWYDI